MAAIREALDLNMKEMTPISSFKVYPNPVSNILFIEELLDVDTQISVTDFTGKNINVDITNGTIDCSHLTSGMYNLAFQHKGIEQQITFIKK